MSQEQCPYICQSCDKQCQRPKGHIGGHKCWDHLLSR